MYKKGRAWIELDSAALIHNAAQLKEISGESCSLMPAVKANAYGHGAVWVSRILESGGTDAFCVASVGEGIELREAGIAGKILILGYTHPVCFPELKRYHLIQTVVDRTYAQDLDRYGRKNDFALPVHIGTDTGMHWLGERSEDINAIAEMWQLKGIRITGVFSHLCVSDGMSREEQSFTLKQIKKFQDLTEKLHDMGHTGFCTHLYGSYGILNYPGYHFDYTRPGIALYGVLSSPGDKIRTGPDLHPVLSLKARVECVRGLRAGEAAGYGLTWKAPDDRKIAIVSAGYADGIPRELSNRGHALVRGKKVPVVGRICMDQLTLDVTEVPDARPGDEAVFIGTSGMERITATEAAGEAGTIANEILSRLGERLERIVL